jgi:4-carboxymuconolactone decarboxylase
MVEDGYGRVLGRPGLDLAVRELCIVGLLCPQDAPRQLYSHLRGALNTGASVEDVTEAVALAAEGLDRERESRARLVLGDVLERRAQAADNVRREQERQRSDGCS